MDAKTENRSSSILPNGKARGNVSPRIGAKSLDIRTTTSALTKIVEPRRKRLRLSLRDAAARAGISEATWRQLCAGGVMQRGEWIERVARRDQVLEMAAAVDVLNEVAEWLDANDEEVASARSHVVIPDPAEEEILSSRFLRTDEKLRLLEQLRALREEPPRHRD